MKKYLPIGIATVSLLSGLPAKANDSSNSGTSNDVLLWDKTALKAIKNTSFTPPNGVTCPCNPEYSHVWSWAAYDSIANSTQLDNSDQRSETENTLFNKNVFFR